MKIFMSWSGNRSRSVAGALTEWLADLFPGLEIWMSDYDIEAGSRWGTEISNHLASSNFGILCLTPENLNAPWILFEAGALAKAVRIARVVPYRLQLTANDVSLPLAQFQGVNADERGTLKLIQSINEGFDQRFSDDRLDRAFQKWWPDLRDKLSVIPPSSEAKDPQPSMPPSLVAQIVRFAQTYQLQQTIIDDSTIMASPISPEELGKMSDDDLNRRFDGLMKFFQTIRTQSERNLLQLELNRVVNELQKRRRVAEAARTTVQATVA
jgi:hypothetical protein